MTDQKTDEFVFDFAAPGKGDIRVDFLEPAGCRWMLLVPHDDGPLQLEISYGHTPTLGGMAVTISGTSEELLARVLAARAEKRGGEGGGGGIAMVSPGWVPTYGATSALERQVQFAYARALEVLRLVVAAAQHDGYERAQAMMADAVAAARAVLKGVVKCLTTTTTVTHSASRTRAGTGHCPCRSMGR